MKTLLLVLAILISTLRLQAQTNATARVALVSDNGEGEVANVLDLATVKLGADKEVVLLDRAAIGKVLAEHQLSMEGALNPNSVVAAGKLLAVDLFAVMDTVTQTNSATGKASRTAAGLVVFNSRTGVRLWDAALSGEGVESLAGLVADGVRTAQRKRVTPGLPTICLMSVRNAELPRGLDGWCESVGLMLERWLTASPGCVVLERERLDQVNKERSLSTSGEQQQLLASLVMMQMECGGSVGGERVWVSLQFTDNAGMVLAGFAVTNQNANGAEIAAALYKEVVAALKLKSGDVNQDRVKEADRFRQEANFFLSHGDLEHGIQGLEAAFALMPDDNGLRRQLAGTLVDYAGTTTNLLQQSRVADRGMDLFLDCARESSAQLNPKSTGASYNFTTQFSEWNTYMRKLGGDTFQKASYLSPTEMDETRHLIRSIYTRYCSFRSDITLPALLQAILHHPDDSKYESRALFHDYGFVTASGLWSTENISALYPEDWSQDWLANLKSYLNLMAQLSLERQLAEAHEIDWNMGPMLFWSTTLEKVRAPDREEAWHLISSHSSPLIRALGKFRQLNAATEEPRQTKAFLATADHTYRLYVEQCLDDPLQATNFAVSQLFYVAAVHIGGAEMVEFCNFMLQRNDLHPDILKETMSYLLSQTNKESAGQAVEFCDRAIALLDQPNLRYFGGSDTNQFLEDLTKQRAIAQNKYERTTEQVRSLPPLPPAWREVRQLIDLAGAKKGLTRIFRPVVQCDLVYAAGFGTNDEDTGTFLQLLEIPLKDGTVKPLTKITVTNVAARIACVDNDNYYLGTSRGIFIFPKSGETVAVLNQTSGLPSDEVKALACLDGKLYIGLGESGYLVSYDIRNKQCEVLCSARRREQLSPFDNGPPLKIAILLADESKHRIVFLTDQDGGIDSNGYYDALRMRTDTNLDVFPLIRAKARAGVFSYCPATREFKCIMPRHPTADFSALLWAESVSDQQFTIAGIWGEALFDCATDKPILLSGICYAIGLWGPSFHGRSFPVLAASFVQGNWVWTASRPTGWESPGYRRISLETGRIDNLSSPRQSDPGFVPDQCFRLIGSDHALIGDQRGLWLATFADDNAETQKAQH